MERIQNLIDKLAKQNKQHASASQMLATVQLLQQELMAVQQESKASGSSKVTVILPGNAFVDRPANREVTVVGQPYTTKEVTPKKVEVPEEDTKVEAQPLVQPTPKVEENVHSAPTVEAEHTEKEETQKKPGEIKVEATAEKQVTHSVLDLHFDAMEETPTLLQQPQIELHELISEKKESLNDRLKQERTELAHVLKDTPIKDLRKAIGINDKFAFVDDLFRGDEVMYERSIKTINNFHILQEAEYWINRELKVKLGWNDNKEIVQHFYSLVRRRFS